MILYNKQPQRVLFVISVLFVPALLFYWFGFPSISKLSLIFMLAGIVVSASQLLSFNKIDVQTGKLILTHGWFLPRECDSIPFDDIKRLSIGFYDNKDTAYVLFLDLTDNTSLSLLRNHYLNPLRARAEKIAGLMKKPLVDQTNWTNPIRKARRFPNASSIQFCLFMGYVFILSPLFFMVAGIGSMVINYSEAKQIEKAVVNRFFRIYQPVIDKAESLEPKCEELEDGYLSGKIAVRLPDSYYKQDWRELLPEQYRPLNAEQVNTVILVDSFEHDWGTSSGTIVLLDEQKKFHFYVTSGRKEKRLGSSIRADSYLYQYLAELPTR